MWPSKIKIKDFSARENSVNNSIIDPLLALQALDTEIAGFEREIKDIPARKQEETRKLEKAKMILAEEERRLLSRKAEADDLDLQLKAKNEHSAKLKQQQEGLKNARAVQAMADQIESSSADADELEIRRANAEESIPDAEERVANAREYVASETQALEGYMKELDERIEYARERVNALKEERKAAAAQIPEADIRTYERLLKSRVPAIVHLHGGVCGGCHLMQSPSVSHLVNRINKYDENKLTNPGLKRPPLVICESCGRILY